MREGISLNIYQSPPFFVAAAQVRFPVRQGAGAEISRRFDDYWTGKICALSSRNVNYSFSSCINLELVAESSLLEDGTL
jgi:hypothetical protein